MLSCMKIAFAGLFAAAFLAVQPAYAQSMRPGDSVAALPEGSTPITYRGSRCPEGWAIVPTVPPQLRR